MGLARFKSTHSPPPEEDCLTNRYNRRHRWVMADLKRLTVEGVVTKRSHRVPRYMRDDPAWRKAEAQRQSRIPRDAIAADLNQQASNNSYSPPLYYQDYEFTCVDCGSVQVWTAAQQKWWYEVAKGSIYAGAKRCRPCRAAMRASRLAEAERNRKPDA
jgi:hypothetical protein